MGYGIIPYCIPEKVMRGFVTMEKDEIAIYEKLAPQVASLRQLNEFFEGSGSIYAECRTEFKAWLDYAYRLEREQAALLLYCY